MTCRLIHVTPELPSTVGGVADYTTILSRRLVEVSDGAMEPVLVHTGKQCAEGIDVDFPVKDLSGQCSATALEQGIERLAVEAERPAVVLLEYSGYGYATRGAPLWLARGIRRVCGEDGVPLITMFHELYATSWRPWTSAFWMSPLQQYVAARLARMSSGIVTNRNSGVSWLRRHGASESVAVRMQPVFSNVGEPDTLPLFEKRALHAVVFGGGGRKSAVYDEHRDLLRQLVDHEEFSRVLDIGPAEDGMLPEESWSRPLGVLSADEISDRLASASLGVLSYPGSRLGKSGVAAAFASYGVPFLLPDEENPYRTTEPYVEGEHFLRGETIRNAEPRLSKERLAEMSQSIRTLYQDRLHSIHAARCFYDLIQPAAHAASSAQTSLQAE